MRIRTLLSALAAASALPPALGAAALQADSYSFTTIATSGRSFRSFTDPTLNDAGTAAFLAEFRNFEQGVIKSSGGELFQIVAATAGPFGSFGDAAVNDAGTVAFRASLDSSDDTIQRARSGSLNTVATTIGSSFFFFGDADINNLDAVAWLAVGAPTGIYARRFGPTVAVALETGPFSYFGPPAINDRFEVVFFAGLDTFEEGIFVAAPPNQLITIASDAGPYRFFGDSPAINNLGTVAFQAGLDAGGEGVFTGSGGPATTVATSSGLFRFFDDPALNDAGQVAFSATLDDGTRGIFDGGDPVANRVIATGDALAGSTVSYLFATSRSLNGSGQIVFFAELADGRQGVFRADP